MVASEGGVHLRIRTSPLTMASEVASRIVERCGTDAMGMLRWRPNREERGNRTPCGCECGVQNGGKLWNGRHWDAEVASRMAGRWEMDARGMLVWRPNREEGGNRTPFGCECGVQNGGKLWNGRQVRLKVASRIVESCGMDAIEKRERRPKSQILINRTPGGRECSVQNCGELGNGRQVRLDAASRMAGRWESDAIRKR